MRDLPVIRRAARARLRRATGPNGTSMSRSQRIGRDLGQAALVRALGLPTGHGPTARGQLPRRPHTPAEHRRCATVRGLPGKRGILTYWVERELEAAAEETEAGGGQDAEQGRQSHYYMEWIEASSPRPPQRSSRSGARFSPPRSPSPGKYPHGEALMTGAALVCQDLSPVEMMFPFADRENAAFCRPDLSDLRSADQELVRDEDRRRRIAQEGRRTITAWTARWREQLLRRHLAAHPGGAELVPAVGSTNGCARALASAFSFPQRATAPGIAFGASDRSFARTQPPSNEHGPGVRREMKRP
jgi:hypothetical protein